MKDTIIHCPTKELFEAVQKEAFRKGIKWIRNGCELKDYWDDYKEETCISILKEDGFKMMYGNKLSMEQDYPNVEIISANEYLNMPITWETLKKGDFVKFPDERTQKILARIEDLVAISTTDDYEYFSSWNVITMLQRIGYTIVQSEQAITEVSMDEVAEKFGVPVKQLKIKKE